MTRLFRKLLRWLSRKPYRLPFHVTEHRFRPGMKMLRSHITETSGRRQ